MMLSCRHAARLLSESLDRPLPRSKRFALKFHVLICTYCRRYGKQIRLLDALARGFAAKAAEAAEALGGLSPEAKARLRDVLRNA